LPRAVIGVAIRTKHTEGHMPIGQEGRRSLGFLNGGITHAAGLREP
jgi:hypothetical protein